MPLAQLKEGQVWVDGLSSGYAWRVESMDERFAHLVLLENGEPTLSTLRWPLNRSWQVMVDRNLLTLKRSKAT